MQRQKKQKVSRIFKRK